MIKRTFSILTILLSGLLIFSATARAQVKSPRVDVDTFPVIYDMIALVDTDSVMSTIQHLQDYGTRNCKKPQAIEAQNWIKGVFESYGLPVELQDFPMGGSDPSDNVIATFTGKIDSDQYVIIGAHYDSYAYGNQEPGADDNASGTAGVLETARILTQYQFEKSIVFIAFSGEEYGMYGSEAYASRAQQEGMNILGYFNIDMCGYNATGEFIHTDMIAPVSAKPLSDFYKAVCALFLPDFPIYDATTIPGGSDHVSFNNHGYMGIFPCEEDETYSPYIHTSNDKIGLSVNSPLKAKKFIQASLSSVVSMARPFTTVGNVEKNTTAPELNLYPNPASERTLVDLTAPCKNASIELFNLTGSRVLSVPYRKNITLDLSGLPEGLYVVKVSGDGFALNKKLLIR
jgi:hypothetical protein